MTTNLRIALGLLLGLAFGLTAAATGSRALLGIAHGVEPVGTAFGNLVRMVVIPLVAATVFTGVARLGDLRRLGRLGALTMSFFWSTLLIAIVMGMAVMRLFIPLLPASAMPAGAPPVERLPTTADFFISLVPSNPIDAAARGALLPLIVFIAIFGAAAGTLDDQRRQSLLDVADAVTRMMIAVVHWALAVAPIGVFALAASATAAFGWSMLKSLAVLVTAVLVGLVVFFSLVYVPVVRFVGGIPAARFLKACIGPVSLAFATTSSAASLPALYDSAAELGLSNTVSSFVLSLGSAINRTGSALFQGACVVFFAAVYGVSLSPSALAGAVLTIFIIAQTVAGVPSAGVITLAPALTAMGIPLGGLPILLGIDRIPDMVRTATQVTGHLAAATVVERMAGVSTKATF